MNVQAIYHRNDSTWIYALDRDTLRVTIRSGKDVTDMTLIAEDPYVNGVSARHPWHGENHKMEILYELKDALIFYADIKPVYRRLQYFFKASSHSRSVLCFEDGCHEETYLKENCAKHYFKYGYMNEADIMRVPEFAKSTIWYQIFPDRFCRGDNGVSSDLAAWSEGYNDNSLKFYGGTLRGIIDKLCYISWMGFNGIYLNPVFCSVSNHKYDTDDYLNVSEDFGSNEDLKELVEKAHALGIRVMLDAVFNHSGPNFFAWADIRKNGRKSAYYDWYFIQSDVEDENFFSDESTRDGRYGTFAYISSMPKLNTSNREVQDYFISVCRHWIDSFDIDAIRFDVGNEISHTFIKRLRSELREYRKDIFLVGEVWTDSISYLSGDEYDSCMNYPLMQQMMRFFTNESLTSEDLYYGLNYCMSLYQRQCTEVMFNLLSSHDVARAAAVAGRDKTLCMYALLLMLPGSPCVYYGDELLLDGASRSTIPWDKLNGNSKYRDSLIAMHALISLYSRFPDADADSIRIEKRADRLVILKRKAKDITLRLYINANASDVKIKQETFEKTLFCSKFDADTLKQNGILITSEDEIKETL